MTVVLAALRARRRKSPIGRFRQWKRRAEAASRTSAKRRADRTEAFPLDSSNLAQKLALGLEEGGSSGAGSSTNVKTSADGRVSIPETPQGGSPGGTPVKQRPGAAIPHSPSKGPNSALVPRKPSLKEAEAMLSQKRALRLPHESDPRGPSAWLLEEVLKAEGHLAAARDFGWRLGGASLHTRDVDEATADAILLARHLTAVQRLLGDSARLSATCVAYACLGVNERAALLGLSRCTDMSADFVSGLIECLPAADGERKKASKTPESRKLARLYRRLLRRAAAAPTDALAALLAAELMGLAWGEAAVERVLAHPPPEAAGGNPALAWIHAHRVEAVAPAVKALMTVLDRRCEKSARELARARKAFAEAATVEAALLTASM